MVSDLIVEILLTLLWQNLEELKQVGAHGDVMVVDCPTGLIALWRRLHVLSLVTCLSHRRESLWRHLGMNVGGWNKCCSSSCDTPNISPTVTGFARISPKVLAC